MCEYMIMITGVAGFIGYSLARCLLESGYLVVGVDNINDYYDISIKQHRLQILKNYSGFLFRMVDISLSESVDDVFKEYSPQVVVNLAAQAGVRYSILNPNAYIESNIIGFFNIVEACKKNEVKHLIFASSSSVYGNIKNGIAKEDSISNKPESFYAATKLSNEVLAYSYHSLFSIPMTGLRFFSVYGPYGRPDMAYYKFANYIMNDKIIPVFNNGNMMRDFTYIDDVVRCLKYFIEMKPKKEYYEIYNIGTGESRSILDLVGLLEKYLNKRATIVMYPMQPGDVLQTKADVKKIKNELHDYNITMLEEGIEKFVDWYKFYHYC